MKPLVIILTLFLSTSIIFAQPPGGGPAGGGDPPNLDRVNPDVPDVEDVELESQGDIDVDIQSEALRGSANFPTVEPSENEGVNIIGEVEIGFNREAFSANMETYEVPDDWSLIDVSDGQPDIEDILAMRDNNEIPDDIDIDALDIQAESDPEATSAIFGYASSMLGRNVTILYAGEYGDSEVLDNPAAQETINQIYGELDADMQSLLLEADSLSGVTYWALLEYGLALLYTGDCDVPNCTFSQEMVQVEVTSGSMGAYGIYSESVPTSTDQAKALIESIYPNLRNVALEPTESDYGMAFFAFDIDMNNGDVTAYYAGVYPTDSGQSLVYALSGVGDAYINVLLGG